MKPPCKDCERRSTACWGTCQLYSEWKKETSDLKAKASYDRSKFKPIWGKDKYRG